MDSSAVCKSCSPVSWPPQPWMCMSMRPDPSSLSDIRFPATLDTIDSYAFQDCTALTEVNLPAGIKHIESGAFSGCSGITEIDLPDGLQSIGGSAFSGTAITELELPDSVTEVSLSGLGNQLTHTPPVASALGN